MFPAMFPASLIVDGNAKATANPHRGLREALSPRYRGPTHLPGPFYLRGPGSVRSAQGGPPAARLAHVDIGCGLDPDSVSE